MHEGRHSLLLEFLEKDISTFAVTCRVRNRKTGIVVPFAQLWNTSKGLSKQRGWPCWDRDVGKHLHRRSKQWSKGHKTSLTALIRVTSTEKISSCFAIARNSSLIHSCESAIVWWVNRVLTLFYKKMCDYYLIISCRNAQKSLVPLIVKYKIKT